MDAARGHLRVTAYVVRQLAHLPMLSIRLTDYFCDAHQSKRLRPSRSWTASSARSALVPVKLQPTQSLS